MFLRALFDWFSRTHSQGETLEGLIAQLRKDQAECSEIIRSLTRMQIIDNHARGLYRSDVSLEEALEDYDDANPSL